jgi:hypothetical protein
VSFPPHPPIILSFFSSFFLFLFNIPIRTTVRFGLQYAVFILPLTLPSKYSPQHFVVVQSQSVLFLQDSRDPCATNIKLYTQKRVSRWHLKEWTSTCQIWMR